MKNGNLAIIEAFLHYETKQPALSSDESQTEKLPTTPVKPPKVPKKKIGLILEFCLVTGIGWVSPATGLFISLLFLLFHLLKPEPR